MKKVEAMLEFLRRKFQGSRIICLRRTFLEAVDSAADSTKTQKKLYWVWEPRYGRELPGKLVGLHGELRRVHPA
jgi:hypothetical protein